MEPAARVFRLESRTQAREALRALESGLSAGPEQGRTVELDYLDTFDWRVYRGEGRLVVVKAGGAQVVEWEPQRGAASLRCPVDQIPAFAWDFPEGAFRDRLAALIEMRRLLPVATVRLNCRQRPILDRRGKTIVRVRTEAGTARDPRRPRQRRTIGVVLRVVPVRGYERDCRRVGRWIDERLGLRGAEECTLARSLAVLGRRPADTYIKPGYPLASGERCDAAMKRILLSLLERIRLNEDGVRADTDTEFLHDFRVAVRRTRSALGQVPDVFPRRVVDRFRRGFAWLGEVSNPVRDLDVQLLRLPEHRRLLPEASRSGLDLVERSLRESQGVAQRRLACALDSGRYRRLVQSWADYLQRPAPGATTLASAALPVERVAGERIRRAHRRVLKRGRKIDDESPPELLHRLRIDCKKLRYLLEFFAELYPAKRIRPMIGALKKLQTCLGDFNDLAVEQKSLAGILERLPDQGDPAADSARQGIEALRARLLERQAETRASFGGQFDQFAGDEVLSRFRELFEGTAS